MTGIIRSILEKSMHLVSCGTLLVAASMGTGCNLIDDEPPPLGGGSDDGGGSGTDGPTTCLDAAVEIQSMCEPPLQFFTQYGGGDVEVVQADDPTASVGVGPNAWLISASASADWITWASFEGDECTIGCAYCQQGQSLCHAGFDDANLPICGACFEGDAETAGAACAAFVDACLAGGGGGVDETGGDDGDGGADETGGGGGVDETGGDGGAAVPEPTPVVDCSSWDPASLVVHEADGRVRIAAQSIEDLVAAAAAPLSECDDTAFVVRPDGYLAVSRRSPSSLVAELGLSAGDVIYAVDGRRVSSVGVATEIALEYFFSSPMPSSIRLTIERGADRFDRRIEID